VPYSILPRVLDGLCDQLIINAVLNTYFQYPLVVGDGNISPSPLDLGERSRGTLRRGVAKLEIINS
jgi:hypothetical protein